MPTSYTPLLGLALPVQGELVGTWGDTVNTATTTPLDQAIAGTVTLAADADVTLTTTTGGTNQARNAVIICSGARTAVRTIVAPASSKVYVVINATTGGFGVKLVGVGPTTGVTIAAGGTVTCVWNGTDFVGVGAFANAIAGTVGIANGGTGQTTAGAALAALGGAPLASPTFTGVPLAPTAAPGTNTTQLATTSFVVTSYAPFASPVFTGDPQAPTAAPGDNDTSIATTAFAMNMQSPNFTGTPTAPTATAGTSTTQLATTNFVTTAVAATVTPVGSVGPWVSGTTYTYGNIVFSPITGQTYRLIVASLLSTVDPSVDTTNWVQVGANTQSFLYMAQGIV